MRVALFVTCVLDTLAPGAAQATVAVLERLGHEVVFPPDQTCCGQVHGNAGHRAEAGELARRWWKVFAAAGADVVVAPSA